MDIFKPFLSVVYIILSGFVIWILSAFLPPILNLLSDYDNERVFLRTFVYLVYAAVIILPQYFLWMLDHHPHFVTPFLALVALMGETMIAAGFIIVLARLVNTLGLTEFSYIIFTFIYWTVLILGMFITQYFIWAEDLGDKLG